MYRLCQQQTEKEKSTKLGIYLLPKLSFHKVEKMKYNINPNFYFSIERQSPILSSKGYRVGGILRGFQHTKSGFSEGKGLLGLRE